MKADKMDLYIAIPTLNEEKNIEKCLQAIGDNFAKEIYILDSGSSDNTLEIAKTFGTTVLTFSWNGQFPKKRNWFLQNHAPKSGWVLFLDADEFINEDFKKEVKNSIENKNDVGYWLHYSRYFMGQKLKGGYPLDKLALFKLGTGIYEKIEEMSWSTLDMEIHEHPILQGTIGKIRAEIEHNDFRGIEYYQKKHIEYAKWEANRFLTMVKSDKDHITFRQKIKYAIIQSSFGGLIFFFIAYFYFFGFLDGKRGWIFAIFKMNYFTMINAFIKEYKTK